MERLSESVSGRDRSNMFPSPLEPSGHELIGTSPAMQTVFAAMERVAPTDATVLLVGESGTGKERVAHAIHEASHRRAGSFLAVNCGALRDPIHTFELFGYERGSFQGARRSHEGLFERASGGTLLLDDVTEMPVELQAHLLRVLETWTFRRAGGVTDIDCDVRVIAATNRSPDQAVKNGTFREELYFRLAVFPLRLPSLRERGNDISLLAEHMLRRLNAESRRGAPRFFVDDALEVLEEYDWPGNVRELSNVIQRAFILCDGGISSLHFQQAIAAGGNFVGEPVCKRAGVTIREMERSVIAETLQHYDGDKRTAAKVLGISLKTLYNRLKAYEAS